MKLKEVVVRGLLFVVLFGVVYFVTSMFVYSWRNPELTQRQVLQSWREALTWSDRG